MSDPTRCLRPPAAVFDYLTGVGVAIDWDYAGLWDRLVDEDLRLQDVVPVAHEAAVKVLRWLVGAPDDAAFMLPCPLVSRTELGERPAAMQHSVAATVAATVR